VCATVGAGLSSVSLAVSQTGAAAETVAVVAPVATGIYFGRALLEDEDEPAAEPSEVPA
jgi:hypothetical protein